MNRVTCALGAIAVDELLANWGVEAALFRSCGAEGQAATLDKVAVDVMTACQAQRDRILTVAEASLEWEYTPDHVRRLIKQKKVRNAGRPGALRVYASDGPRKPALAQFEEITQLHVTSRQQVARSYLKKGD